MNLKFESLERILKNNPGIYAYSECYVDGDSHDLTGFIKMHGFGGVLNQNCKNQSIKKMPQSSHYDIFDYTFLKEVSVGEAINKLICDKKDVYVRADDRKVLRHFFILTSTGNLNFNGITDEELLKGNWYIKVDEKTLKGNE